MARLSRRAFLTVLGSAAAAGSACARCAAGAGSVGDGKTRIRVGQIGTKHAHAAGKMSTLRKYDELFEVVGVVEPGVGGARTYRGSGDGGLAVEAACRPAMG